MAIAYQTLQASERPLTVRDYASSPDDGNRYEIIGGELSVSASPTLEHQRIAGRIFVALERYFEETRTGEAFFAPIDVELSNFDVVEPDVVVVLDANASVKHEKRIVGAPDIVVEIDFSVERDAGSCAKGCALRHERREGILAGRSQEPYVRRSDIARFGLHRTCSARGCGSVAGARRVPD